MLTTIILLFCVYLVADWLLRKLKVGNYSNKCIFVTGCDSGFGRDLAIRLEWMGFHVFAGCLTEQGEKYLSNRSNKFRTLRLDVTDQDSIQNAEKFVRENLPHEKALWGIVNNAGVSGQIAPLEMCTRQEMIATCQVNLFGPVEVTRVFLPLLRKSRGRVVSIGSVMGRYPAASGLYCVSKFGMEAFSDVLRREVAPFGIKVSLLEPGYHRTPLLTVDVLEKHLDTAFSRSSPDVQKAYGGESFVSRMTALVISAVENSSWDTFRVVDAYVDALTARFPRPRYVVGWDAKLFFVPMSFLPEWLIDPLVLWLQKFQLKKKGFDA